jgi:hypothetical protein
MRDAAISVKDRQDVERHFTGRSSVVREIYDRIHAASSKFGPVAEDPKKTSIHLVNRSAFAGIQTRRESIVLTLKSTLDIDSDRIFRRERASANRWYLYLKLTSPDDVDAEMIRWLETSYRLSG